MDAYQVLRTVPLLRHVPEPDLRSLATMARERSHPKGGVILSQGDPGDALYLIRTGQVKVIVIAEDGREVILSILAPGSVFGENGSAGR
jgi:CRP/FNR family cyclic AMP-dependent transcriptional regulator